MLSMHTASTVGGVRSTYTSKTQSPRCYIKASGDNGYLKGFKIPSGSIFNGKFLRPLDNKSRQDFIIRVMKYNPAVARAELKFLNDHYNDQEDDSFFQLFVLYRNRYVETGSQICLQLAKLSIQVDIFRRINLSKLDKLLISPIEYMKYSIEFGSEFTLFVKKLRSYATLSTVSHSHFIDLEEKIEELNQNYFNIKLDIKDKWSYDDFLSESYLLFFEEEVNDYEYAFKEVYSDPSALATFRVMIKKILFENKLKVLRDPSDDEIMTWTSDSSSFCSSDPESKSQIHKTAVRNEILKESKAPYGKLVDNLSFTRSIIPVGPGNFRDSWMPDLDSLFTIKKVSYYMRQIIESIPYSAMYDENVAYRRKQFLRSEKAGKLFLLLDFKKSGLTINRELLQIMGEELEIAYPGVEALANIKDCYTNLKVWNGKNYDRPCRGTGLGNMNELYTLFQCATGELMNIRWNTKSIFFNDDACIELQQSKWKQQLNFVMSYLHGLGQIVNLGKTVVSRSNIFCEEYIIHSEEVYNYDKIQLMVMPFAESLLQATTHQAKRYFYSIDRQLIGSGLRHISAQFLEYAHQIYPSEFGSLDTFLPYHIGGWVDFSDSNFSCLFEYMLDPREYVKDSNDLGYIPEIRRWIQFNRDRLHDGQGLLSTSAKIRYRQHLTSTLKSDVIFTAEDDFSKFIYAFTGLGSVEQYKDMLDNIINCRGLHNAKPRIRIGLAMKEEKRRRLFFEEYKKNKMKQILFEPQSIMNFKTLLTDIKEMDEAPAYLRYPRFLIKKSEEAPRSRQKKVLIVDKREGEISKSLPLIHRRIVANTIASVQNKIWVQNSDPFILGDLWRSAKSGYLISDNELRYRRNGVFEVPFLYECFCPNKRLFIAEIQTRTGRCPLEYVQYSPDHRDFHMYLYKDAFEMMLPPDLIGRWREIKKRFKKHLFILRYLISLNTLRKREEFVSTLNTIENIQDDILEEDIPEELEELPESYEHFFARIDQSVYLERLIEDKLSIDDLLEESDIDYFSDSEEGSENEEKEDYGYPSYRRPKRADELSEEEESEIDFENDSLLAESEPESGEESLLEHDFEVSSSFYGSSSEKENSEVEEESSDNDEPSDNSDSHESENEEDGDEEVLFNRYGVGLGANKHLRINLHTLEEWDMRDAHERMNYARHRKKWDLEITTSNEEEIEKISLNEIRRLLRNEAAYVKARNR